MMAIVDLRSDLYIIGWNDNQRVWMSNVFQVAVVGSQNEVLVLKQDCTVHLIKPSREEPIQLPFQDIVQIAASVD